MIALMSVAQSEKMMTEERSKSIAFWIPLERAKALAVRGELTFSMIWEPERGWIDKSLVMLHAIPARFEKASQAASTKHDGVEDGLNSFRWLLMLGNRLLFVDLSISWAWSHSNVAANAFEATPTGRLVLFSKINLFLVVHRNQQIHGRIGILIPVGGRQIALLKSINKSLKSTKLAMWTDWWSGIRRQASLAKGHRNKTCIVDSTSLQRGQRAGEIIPLCCNSTPISKAPCKSDQRSNLSFGVVLVFQTSLIQLNYRSAEEWRCAVWGDKKLLLWACEL